MGGLDDGGSLLISFLASPPLPSSLSPTLQLACSFKNITVAMFIATLFTIAETWKQPKCPSTEEWVKKMWYVYTGEYYLAIKNDMPFVATWMDLEISIPSEVSHRKTNIL